MGLWTEPKGKVMIAKDGKKSKTATYKKILSKNSKLKGCKYNNTWNGTGQGTLKFKQPEGVYEIKIGVAYKTGQKVKQMSNNAPGGIPADCKLDSCWEFPEIRIFIKSLKMPKLHTCEVDVIMNRVKNFGTSKDLDPWAMFDIDVRTGHMVMGSWTTHMGVCDVFAGKQKVAIR
ncbi:hypothetical protein [Tateyamaria sp.]|uniref:hypothetical protein n=1 Tax=Tateyamaria sp. TaxID=1929288 RepID=UPI00329E1165